MPEFLLQDAAQVLAAEGADAILGGGPGLEAVSKPRDIRRSQAGRASGVGPLLEGRQARCPFRNSFLSFD